MSEEQFIPTPAQMLYGADHGSFAVPEWADNMFCGMLREWERVWWNVKQESWPDRPSGRQILGRVVYQPYVWDACDCGGKEIQHKPDCRWVLEHGEWNSRRIESCRPHPNDPDWMKAAEVDMAAMAGATEAAQAWLTENPRPPCTCGEADGWEERECSDTCISNAPNFGIVDDIVQIRWYKYPHRGMSVSVPLTADGWIAWHDRVIDALDEVEHAHELERYEGSCLRYPCKRCGKGVSGARQRPHIPRAPRHGKPRSLRDARRRGHRGLRPRAQNGRR